ncbi:MAG: 4-hydroxy-3-methylbut-2-enyl diphosphate reductase [Acidobacteriota bacterium]
MKIEVAKYSGYCYGVERAFKMVRMTAAARRGKIHTLGPIIHNRQAVEALNKNQGVETVETLDDIMSGTVIIRTHGVPPQVLEDARARGLEVVDATCPFVKKAQDYAKQLVDEGYHLIIIGERNHPEVIGIKAHSGGGADIVEDEDEARKLSVDTEKLGIVIQTTQESEKVGRIIGILSMKTANVRIYNTICDATFHRQFSARELAQRMDSMIVVGGKHSGNTRRLYDICREVGAVTYYIETADEIKEAWLDGIENVGVTAGASTPDFILQEVIDRLNEIGRGRGAKRNDG